MFVNIKEHPSNRNKKVFYFKEEKQANYFQELLEEKQLKYERQVDSEGDQTIYFGVLAGDFKQAKKMNYLTHGKFRKPFIPDPLFRYFLIIVTLFVLGLAILGAFLAD